MLLTIPSGRQPLDNFGEGNVTWETRDLFSEAGLLAPETKASPRKGHASDQQKGRSACRRVVLPPHGCKPGVSTPRLVMIEQGCRHTKRAALNERGPCGLSDSLCHPTSIHRGSTPRPHNHHVTVPVHSMPWHREYSLTITDSFLNKSSESSASTNVA